MDIFNNYQDFSKLIREIAFTKSKSQIEAFLICNKENVKNIDKMLIDYLSKIGFIINKENENNHEYIFGSFFKEFNKINKSNIVYIVEGDNYGIVDFSILIKEINENGKVKTQFTEMTINEVC